MHPLQIAAFVAAPNALGFGATDFVELTLVAALIAFARMRVQICRLFVRFAEHPVYCFAFVAALPVLLRLALLRNHPVPTPDIYDEFGHLFVADTLSHLRFANPTHPLHRFFETFFVLQEPTYSAIYPLGQGMVLALGSLILGTPWAGVVLSIAAMCGACYWTLLGWTTRRWALVGGLLAVIEFGPLNEWMNSYWGGAVSAIAGCLVFGALPRLARKPRLRESLFLGAGIGIQLNTRPYESILLALSVFAFFAFLFAFERQSFQRLTRVLPAGVIVAALAAGLVLVQNKQVTGKWMTLPYMVSQYQYGVPTSLTIQANPVPHVALTREQVLDYKAQRSFHGEGRDSVRKFLERMEYRVRHYRFFFLPPLYIALGVFIVTIRKWPFIWVAVTLAVFALGCNLFPYLYPRYIAAATCLFLLAGVIGLRKIAAWQIRGGPAGYYAAALLLVISFGSFVFWYGEHLREGHVSNSDLLAYETWDQINHKNPARRIFVQRELAKIPGRLLVFVRYWPNHIFQDEWVYNAANIDASRIVWARDLGAMEDEKLRRYFPDRQVWLLEPDARPPALTRYEQDR